MSEKVDEDTSKTNGSFLCRICHIGNKEFLMTVGIDFVKTAYWTTHNKSCWGSIQSYAHNRVAIKSLADISSSYSQGMVLNWCIYMDDRACSGCNDGLCSKRLKHFSYVINFRNFAIDSEAILGPNRNKNWLGRRILWWNGLHMVSNGCVYPRIYNTFDNLVFLCWHCSRTKMMITSNKIFCKSCIKNYLELFSCRIFRS